MTRLKSALLAASLMIAGPAGTGLAQSAPFGNAYDSTIPHLSEVEGHEFGAEITAPVDAVEYLYALEAAAPDRIKVIEYARSWQDRPLVYAVIGTAERLADLDGLKSQYARLGDPRDLSTAERDALIAELPPVVWLSYGVHGDEISSTDAGLWTAYHLLAAQNDPMVESILANTLVVVDPVQNPDGRARFLANFDDNRGLEANDDRYTAEHDQNWPGGRFNHYLFDMNRDWFARTQPETVGRVAALQDWQPVVVVDAHEMSGDSSYFFAPSAEPFNPNITTTQRETQHLIGHNHAHWFDRFGYDYFTREVFDAFYPGYGDMWPTLQGAIAMTYEQGSPRGLAWRRVNGSVLTYGDAVTHHFVSSLSTIQAVAENREDFVRNYLEFRLGPDTSDAQAMMLDVASNPWNAHRMARNLAAQGIDVSYAPGAVSACGASFQDGAYVVRYDQPAGRLARTLMQATTDLPSDFITRQEHRRDAGLGHELYDVTAWSLPLMNDVDMAECRRAPTLANARLIAEDSAWPVRAEIGEASYGYAVPWTDAGQARLVAALAAEGVEMRTSPVAFTMGGTRYPGGSVIIPRHANDSSLDFLVSRKAEESQARVSGLSSSWASDGPNPGSGHFRPLVDSQIAMVWGDGTSPTSAGATRYILEQRYGMPVGVIRARTLARADLSRYDVVILPESRGSYARSLGGGGAAALREFVEEGGTLVGLGNATRWLASEGVDLMPMSRERAADTPTGSNSEDIVAGTVLEDMDDVREAEASRNAFPDSSPGALVRVTANPNAWMSAGYEDGSIALASGSDIYAPVPMDDATTALRFAAPDDLLAGGYVWAEYAEQLALKPFVVQDRVGSGHVVAFTQSPTTRAYIDGLDLLLLNAVLLGPAHSRAFRD